MDSLPIGSDTLLSIRTSRIDFIIKSKGKAKPLAVDPNGERSALRIVGVDVEGIRITQQGISETYKDNSGISIHEINVSPLFFEQTDYVITIKSRDGSRLEFRSNSSQITDRVSQVIDDDASLLSGVVNYGSSVGFSDLNVYSNGRSLLSVRIEVYPTKISYKKDYRDMMADINNIVNGSVIDFMKKAFQGFAPGNKKNYIPAVFFAIMQGIYKDFVKSINRIIAVPHHKLVTDHEVMPYYKVKRLDGRSEKWLKNHPEYVKKDGVSVIAEKVLAARKHTTYDTQENQLVKFMIESTIRRLEDFHDRYVNSVNDPDIDITLGLRKMESELRRLINSTFLSDVSTFNSTKSMSLVFGMAPGYRELYKYYIMLQNGLSVHGEVFRLSYKDTAVLYEYWCFIKLYSILKEHYELKSPDIIKVDRSGVTVDLLKGRSSRVDFYNNKTGEKISLTYNPTETKTETVNQKPDNVLELVKKGAENKYKYVFDAKYRIETNPDGVFYPDSKPGPKVDDINTMHRYRDSIVYENPRSRFTFEKTMFGAYILFPYNNEEEYKDHRFYKSIDSVNVGGLPFLPSATILVTEMLEDLISDSSESAFERASLPVGIESKLAEVNWDIRDVLVKAVNKEQFSEYYDNKYCDIPADMIRDDSLVHYIALYKPKEHFGDGSGIECCGMTLSLPRVLQKEDGKEVYRFRIDSWNKLPNRVQTKELGFSHMYTNMFLLNNSVEIPELFIKSDAEYRLYKELKRLMIQAEVKEDDDKPEPVLKIGDQTIWFDQNRVIYVNDNGLVFERILDKDYRRRPNSLLKQLIKLINRNNPIFTDKTELY